MKYRPEEVLYSGRRTSRDCRIFRTDPGQLPVRINLAPSLRIWRHSPSGFEWGYGGSGPAQTALAILFDWTKDQRIASQFHQNFKFEIVARFGNDWKLTGQQIEDALAHFRAQREERARRQA